MQSSSRTSGVEPTRSRAESRNWYRCCPSIGKRNEQSAQGHSRCGQAGFRSRGSRIHRRKRWRSGCPVHWRKWRRSWRSFAQGATLGPQGTILPATRYYNALALCGEHSFCFDNPSQRIPVTIGEYISPLHDDVISAIFVQQHLLCLLKGGQIVCEHEIPALHDIEHSFSSNPRMAAGTVRSKRRFVNPSIGGKPSAFREMK